MEKLVIKKNYDLDKLKTLGFVKYFTYRSYVFKEEDFSVRSCPYPDKVGTLYTWLSHNAVPSQSIDVRNGVVSLGIAQHGVDTVLPMLYKLIKQGIVVIEDV